MANAQSWQITTMANAPEKITNNAVCEGYVAGVPYIYTFGGLDSTKIYSGIHLRSYRYDTQMNVWDSIASLPDGIGKIAAGANLVKDKIYIIGGYHVFSNGSEVSSNKVHVYDPSSNSYMADGANIPVATDDHVQVVWRDSLIYVITGWSNSGNIANTQIYNPFDDTWQVGTSVPNNNFYKSFGASGAIVGDTIYYFGGASMSGNFNIQPYFRKGVIDPLNPAQITWTYFSWVNNNGYRMAATTALGKVFWLGGSGVTYNYNGVAYNGSGGVSPLGRSLYYDVSDQIFNAESGLNLPMDLRGIGNVSDTVKYLVGGIQAGQQVTNQTLRLSLNVDSFLTPLPEIEQPLPIDFQVSPNPASDFLNIDITSLNEDLECQLYTTSGVCLRKQFVNKQQTTLDIKNLQPGLYFVQLIGEQTFGVRAVVVH